MRFLFLFFILGLLFLTACTTNSLEEETTKLANNYYTFNEMMYNQSLAEGKVVLLYFYASWCPTCQSEEKELVNAFNQMEIDDVVAYRVNYKDSNTNDFEKNLAKEYGIAYQHTKVILKNNQVLVKAPDSWNTQRYLTEIENFD